MAAGRTYIAIDLKSFYASVECRERGLDPMTTHLVVADESRTEKTICLAVSPSLKAYGIPGRPRLFEVVQAIRDVNARRQRQAPGGRFTGGSWSSLELAQDPALEVRYITAPPRMACYMRYSTGIYNSYLRFVAPEDIHVYSIDEVFIDLTDYLKTYRCTARALARRMIHEIYAATGITATAGIGTNLYLCKVAMDIVAKHAQPDREGLRLAELDEASYRELLWQHRPLADFWRVGRGYQKKLEAAGLYTMGDVARCSLHHEQTLYRLFGVNAELLIDHAWGWESCTMAEIKAYKPATNSLSAGQVLSRPYTFDQGKLIVREMAEHMALSLVDKGLVTDQLTLTIGYDVENLKNPDIARTYHGQVTADSYGRQVPKHAHGTANLARQTASARLIRSGLLEVYDRVVNPGLLVRRVTLCANRVTTAAAQTQMTAQQLDLFSDYEAQARQQQAEEARLERETRIQKTLLQIQKRYGKNAIVKAMNLDKDATEIDRNGQIGGHKA